MTNNSVDHGVLLSRSRPSRDACSQDLRTTIRPVARRSVRCWTWGRRYGCLRLGHGHVHQGASPSTEPALAAVVAAARAEGTMPRPCPRPSSGRRGRGVRLAPAYHGSDRRWLEGKAPTPAPAAVDDTARHARDYATHAVRAGAAQLLFQLPSHMATFMLMLLAGAGAALASSVSRRAAIPTHVARGAVPAPAARQRRFGFGSSSSCGAAVARVAHGEVPTHAGCRRRRHSCS